MVWQCATVSCASRAAFRSVESLKCCWLKTMSELAKKLLWLFMDLFSKDSNLTWLFLSYPQVCTSCSPVIEYVRLFDVTERTSLHRHGTGRRCNQCGGELRDTIVHFGERGTLEQPLNWKGAAEAAKMADVILCLGSSLKVGFINHSRSINLMWFSKI